MDKLDYLQFRGRVRASQVLEGFFDEGLYLVAGEEAVAVGVVFLEDKGHCLFYLIGRVARLVSLCEGFRLGELAVKTRTGLLIPLWQSFLFFRIQGPIIDLRPPRFLFGRSEQKPTALWQFFFI